MGAHILLLCSVERYREAGNAGSTPEEFTGWLGRQNRCRKVSTRLVAMRMVGTISAARVLRRYRLGWSCFRWVRFEQGGQGFG